MNDQGSERIHVATGSLQSLPEFPSAIFFYLRHMKNIIVSCLCTIVALSHIAAQFGGPDFIGGLESLGSVNNNILMGMPGASERSESLRGTPNVFKDWMNGMIYLKDGNQYASNAAFNVDCITGAGIIILTPSGDALDVRESLVSELRIEEAGRTHTFRPVPAKILSGRDAGLWVVEVLHEDGNDALYKRHVKLLRMSNQSSTYNTEGRHYSYADENEYYLQLNNKVTRIRLNASDLKKSAPHIAAKIKGRITEDSLVDALRK